jgi:hypothetical protein
MKHPFDLQLTEVESLNLEFQDLSDEQAANITGGADFSTQAVGEEGGCFPSPPSLRDGTVTTMALGEEGGCFPSPPSLRDGTVTTMALGEEGGDDKKII